MRTTVLAMCSASELNDLGRAKSAFLKAFGIYPSESGSKIMKSAFHFNVGDLKASKFASIKAIDSFTELDQLPRV